MERKKFISQLLTLTGTVFLASSCKEDFFEDLASPSLEFDEDVSGLKTWFENVYLKSSLRLSSEKKFKRKMNWGQITSLMHKGKKFHWVPIDYEEEVKANAILTWKEGDDFVLNMVDHLSFQLMEGFLITKKGKKADDYEGFIMQLGFDPLYSEIGSELELKNYTGKVIHSDWDDNILRLWDFKKGKLTGGFDKERASKSRQICTTYYYTYSEVTGQSCGPNCHEVYYTLHTVPKVFCYEEGGGYSGSGFDEYPSGGSVTSYHPYAPDDPANWGPYDYRRSLANLYYDQEVQRPNFQRKFDDAIAGIGLANGLRDFSIAKAEAMARTLGLPADDIKVLVEGTGTKFLARLFVAYDGYSLIMAIGENGFNVDQYDAGDAAALLGVVGFFLAGWPAVAVGGLAVGFAIYDISQN